MSRLLLRAPRRSAAAATSRTGLAEEVRFHLEQYTDELVRSGLAARGGASPRAAGVRQPRQRQGRLPRGPRPAFLDELQRDLRHAIRLVRKAPAFTATALLTLALCLGANLAIFAVVDSVLLRPLPFPAADRLVRVFNTYPKAGVPDDGCSVTNYYERRGHLPAFSALAAYREGTAIVGEPGATERELVMRVTPDFFATAGRRSRDGPRVHGRGDHVSRPTAWPSSPTPTGGSAWAPTPT